MTSSGIKRGLATSAVAAMAVAGLPLFAGSASAQPMVANYATTGAELFTEAPFGVRNDGDNTNVHLVAAAGSDVAQMRFQYTSILNPTTPATIATVSASNGVFSTNWTPPTNLYGLSVTVTAQPLNNAGGEIGTPQSTTGLVDANATTIDIGQAPGAQIGLFEAPYTESAGAIWGVISGTTSDLTNDVTVQDQGDDPTADDDVTVAEGDGTSPTPAGVYGEPASGVRTWKGAANFDGYDWGTDTDVDQAAAQAVADTDDNEALTVYKQAITTVTASAAKTTPPASNPDTTSTVTVKDQNGNAIAGAEVVEEGPDTDTDGVGTGTDTDTDNITKYTDVNGQATFDVAGSADGNTYTYTVNTDDEDGYQAGKDFQRTVTVTSYNDAANAISLTQSDLGNAIDFDEYADSPVVLTVNDQNGNPSAGKTVQYQWHVDPFDSSVAAYNEPASSVVTGTDGTVAVPAPAGADSGTYTLYAWIEKDGNPGRSAGDLQANPLDLKMGEAEILWADGENAQAKAGTTATLEGTLELEDGTGLPGREVTFSYAPGTEQDIAGTTDDESGPGDSFVAATQPAGTTRNGNNSATDTTDNSGAVQIALSDPSENPQPSELNASLDANTTGDAADAGANADALDVDWLNDTAVDTDNSRANAYDMCDDEATEGATPGRPVQIDVYLQNAAGDALTDVPVTATTDHGFFSNNVDPTPESADVTGSDTDYAWYCDELTPDPAASEGANYGEWKDLGTSFNTTTDDAGYTNVVVAIERDPGFDDDGQVTANVQIQAGGETLSVPVTFDSSDPLNPGALTITLADDQTVQDSTFPNAPTSEDVNWDVKATDQFGNRTDVPVSINDGSSPADVDNTSVTSNWEGGHAVTTSSAVETDQTLHGTWVADTATWTDGSTTTPGFQEEISTDTDSVKTDTKTLTADSETIHWYDIDYANGTYTLSHSGTDPQPVGTTVSETYKAVDQNGEPIQGLYVEFYRTGPDNNHTGAQDGWGFTNQNGEAYYVFQGETAGTATVNAVVYQDYSCLDFLCTNPQGTDRIPGADRTDQIEFAGQPTTGPRTRIKATLSGHNNGAKADRLFVNAPAKAARAQVKLYRVKHNGKLVLLKNANLNKHGNRHFKVVDTNGNKKTNYVAYVKRTADTKGDRTNHKRVR